MSSTNTTTNTNRNNIIVAVDLMGGFGMNGTIPWYYPEDLKRFKSITNGHRCVMGRLTYNEINDKIGDKGNEAVLPGRLNYVLTSTALPRPNAIVIESLSDLPPVDEADDRDTFFIGGQYIFEQSIHLCDTLYISIVNISPETDRKFPVDIVMDQFDMVLCDICPTSPDLAFTKWVRK